ncbi:hypothetical protein WMF27_20485 [Sorangium sp. So ce281]|uniref:hypothetical protein n=1 Tax=unclassified Sorangium TaxID=2621164 RepID=UPI003F5E1873
MSSNLGIGACGFGSSRYGFGSPAQVNSSTAELLRRPDGTYGDCALIDTRSGDFVLDDAGNKVGWESLSQMVYLALRTALASSAVQTMGIELPTGVITDNIATRNRQAVEAALKSMTARNLISIIDVTTARVTQSGVQVAVKWKALSTGKVETTFV